MDDEPATLDGQFWEFARLMDNKRDGTTMTLYRNDYWMRQSKLIDDRKVTMCDTGVLWWKFWYKTNNIVLYKKYQYILDQILRNIINANVCEGKDVFQNRSKWICGFWLPLRENGHDFIGLIKTELTWDEWYEFLTDLCILRNLDQEQIELNMTNCGIPGTSAVFVPQYRDFFDTYKPKEKMMF